MTRVENQRKEYQNKIKKTIKEYQNNVIVLKDITTTTKKDGTPFKDLNKNFVFKTLDATIAVNTTQYYMLYLTINCYKMNVSIEHHLDNHLETIDQVKDLINNLIALYESYIKHYEKALETSEYYLNKIDKIINEYSDLLKELKNDKEQYLGCVDFKLIDTQNGNYYKIREYLKEATEHMY